MDQSLILALLVCMAVSTAPGSASAATEVHRSSAARTAFKKANPCPATVPHKKNTCPGFVIDHVVPLACGGADSAVNMQWQSVAEAKAKDKWERKGCK